MTEAEQLLEAIEEIGKVAQDGAAENEILAPRLTRLENAANQLCDISISEKIDTIRKSVATGNGGKDMIIAKRLTNIKKLIDQKNPEENDEEVINRLTHLKESFEGKVFFVPYPGSYNFYPKLYHYLIFYMILT